MLVENALFATLDPTVRKAQTPDGIGYTLSDTVGFVRSLPTQLVEAFRSTLEEVADADVILHVVDASHPDPEGQIRAVREVIAEVDARHIPEIILLKKAVRMSPPNCPSMCGRATCWRSWTRNLRRHTPWLKRPLLFPNSPLTLRLSRSG